MDKSFTALKGGFSLHKKDSPYWSRQLRGGNILVKKGDEHMNYLYYNIIFRKMQTPSEPIIEFLVHYEVGRRLAASSCGNSVLDEARLLGYTSILHKK